MKNPIKRSIRGKSVSKSKIFIDKLKSQPKWKLGYLAIVFVLTMSVIGHMGIVKYNEHSLKAQAINFSFITKQNGIGIYACKEYINAYGGVWRIKAIFQKAKSTPGGTYTIVGYRNNNIVDGNRLGNTWWNGTVAQQTIHLSAIHNSTLTGGDHFNIFLNTLAPARPGPGVYYTGLKLPANVAYC